MVIIVKIINYEKIEENINEIIKTNRLYPVLKNDAYGFNINKLLNILEKKEIEGYFINTFDEAIALREKTTKPIFLMGKYINDITKLIKYNIIPTASSLEEIKLYSNNRINYAIKINVGMNRFGFDYINNELLKDKYLCLVYAHFPMLDDNTLNIIDNIKKHCDSYNKKYCVGGSILFGITNSSLRIGYKMYKDSIFLYGKIIGIRELSKNDTVGYNKEYKANKKEKIAILDIGYYNGIRVGFNGFVYYKNNRYKVVGRVCMNHMFILASDDMKLGEYVELISNNIGMKEFIKYNNCTEYEAFLSIK